MKKFFLAVLAAALLIGYPLATYLLGVRTEATVRAWTDALPETVPYVKVVRNDYQRSLFKATHTVELQATLPGMDAPITATLQDEIQHGPFPGFNSLGVARVKHTFVLPPKIQQEITKVLGDKPPLTATTTLKFGGSGNTRISSPAFTYKDAQGEATWQGIEATFDFTKGYQRVNYTFLAPGFSAKTKDGAQLQVEKVSANGQQEKMPQTESLYLGSATFGVQSVSVSGAPAFSFSLANLIYSVETRSPMLSFVDASGKFSAQNIKVMGEDWGSAEYVFAAKHLHAPSLDAINKTIRQAYNTASRKSSATQSSDELQTVMLNTFKKHGGALLRNEPIIEIEKLRFGTEKEFLSLNASARFAGVTEADIANPMQLLPKLNARAEVTLAEAMLTRIASKVPSAPGRNNANVEPAAVPMPGAEPMPTIGHDPLMMVNAQIDNAVSLGYVIRGGGILKSTISFSDGKLMINGRAFEGAR